MRRAASAILILMMAAPAVAGILQEGSDRFSGTHHVRWSSIPGQSGGFALSTTAFYGKNDRPPAYSIALLTWSDSWQFLDCSFLSWLVDGSPAPYLQSKYSHSMAGTATMERFDIRISRENLEILAGAKLIEFKACNTEGVVSESDLDGLRQVVDKTK
jgi:hypothetical protein